MTKKTAKNIAKAIAGGIWASIKGVGIVLAHTILALLSIASFLGEALLFFIGFFFMGVMAGSAMSGSHSYDCSDHYDYNTDGHGGW